VKLVVLGMMEKQKDSLFFPGDNQLIEVLKARVAVQFDKLVGKF